MITMSSPEVGRVMKRKVRLKHPVRPFYDVMPDGAWKGHRCFLIGGGNSLRGFDFEVLRGQKVIAVNAAFRFIPFADILFFMDYQGFYHKVVGNHTKDSKIKQCWEQFEGHKVFLDMLERRSLSGCHQLHTKTEMSIGITASMKDGLYNGGNSGFGALNLAICLQANPIYLLGYDMKFTGGVSHFHNIYRVTHDKTVVKAFIRPFHKVADKIKGMGFRVVNLNPASALRCFEKGRIEDMLKVEK